MSKKFNILKKLTQDELDGLEQITDPSILEEFNLYGIKLRKNGTLDQRSRKTAETEYNNLLKQKRQKELENSKKSKTRQVQKVESDDSEDEPLETQIKNNMARFKTIDINDGPSDEYSESFQDIITKHKQELKRYKQQLKAYEAKMLTKKKTKVDVSDEEEEEQPKKKIPTKKVTKKVESEEEEDEQPKKKIPTKKVTKKVESEEEEEPPETKKKIPTNNKTETKEVPSSSDNKKLANETLSSVTVL